VCVPGFKVVNAGERAAAFGNVNPEGGSVVNSGNLVNFYRGNSWDIQRLGGSFDPRFIGGATVLIGMYAASSGMTRSEILNIENLVAGSYPKGTVMDSTYKRLPVRNVANTDIGMRLIQSGAYAR
jgi:hypothetical protein